MGRPIMVSRMGVEPMPLSLFQLSTLYMPFKLHFQRFFHQTLAPEFDGEIDQRVVLTWHAL